MKMALKFVRGARTRNANIMDAAADFGLLSAGRNSTYTSASGNLADLCIRRGGACASPIVRVERGVWRAVTDAASRAQGVEYERQSEAAASAQARARDG
jgi:hypothetical protein